MNIIAWKCFTKHTFFKNVSASGEMIPAPTGVFCTHLEGPKYHSMPSRLTIDVCEYTKFNICLPYRSNRNREKRTLLGKRAPYNHNIGLSPPRVPWPHTRPGWSHGLQHVQQAFGRTPLEKL